MVHGKPGRPRTTRSPLLCMSISLTQAQWKTLDRMAARASKETGVTISRSTIVRTLMDMGIAEAERVRNQGEELERLRRKAGRS